MPLPDKVLANVYMEVDGYYVYATGSGFLEAHQLREIADHLDHINAAWDAKVQSDPAIGGTKHDA